MHCQLNQGILLAWFPRVIKHSSEMTINIQNAPFAFYPVFVCVRTQLTKSLIANRSHMAVTAGKFQDPLAPASVLSPALALLHPS